MTNTMTVDTNESFAVEDFANDSYLNYSMYVIMDRALPHIGDGLKPVHRRIIYAMDGLSLSSSAKYKKSARTVGDTLGKYHPHGDTSCYEAMVLMAQPFSTRLPLIDGQGNWGSQDDPKSFAAMRYTESKLTKYSDTLLNEINQGTVDWKPNFDGTMKEPIVLPAQLPNVLINGSSGIAVGMATDIPPHNVNEVTQACILTMERIKTTDDEILDIIIGPDYPTAGNIITPLADIREAYKKGQGSLKIRAEYVVIDDEIIITSLPYQAQVTKILVEISDQVENKKLPMITTISDESDEKTPIRIILTMKNKRIDADAVMAHLFATTNLEKSQKINLNMIGLDKLPKTKSVPAIVREWCVFRQDIFERKKAFRLDKVITRLHLVEGLLIAFTNLDEVIRIIREEDDPKQHLMASFDLTDIQAHAILELRLRQLAKLEEQLLLDESEALRAERDTIVSLLADDKKIKRAVVSELKATLKEHDSPRRSHFTEAKPAKAISEIDITPPSNVTVVLSKNNWVRTAKGHGLDLSNLNYKSGDKYSLHLETRTNLPTLIISKLGRFFSLDTKALPNAKTVGEPLSTMISIASDDSVFDMIPYEPEKMLLITTTKGNGFKVPMTSLETRAKKGKHIISIVGDVEALKPQAIIDEDKIVLLTKSGRMSIIDIAQVNESNKSQGVRLISVKDEEFLTGDDKLVSSLAFKSGDSFTLTVGKRDYKITPDKQIPFEGKRARKGVLIEQKSKTPLLMSLSK